MKLQGRTLSLQLQGADVELLHKELRLLGLPIDEAEIAKTFFGESTRQAVYAFQKQHGLPTSGVVDELTAKHINAEVDALPPPAPPPQSPPGNRAFVVEGHVFGPSGKAITGVLVRAFDRDLRSEAILGKAITDDGGRYFIPYGPDQLRNAEKKRADLLVRAEGAHGAILASSSVLFNAPSRATLDLTLATREAEPSEYEGLVADVTPLLQGLSLAELTADDIDHLAGKTGLEATRLGLLVAAARLAAKTALPAEIFYGLARRGLPVELRALLSQSQKTLRGALAAAVTENLIPVEQTGTLESTLQRLQQLFAAQTLETPALPTRSSLGALLGTTPLSTQAQEALALAVLDYQGPPGAFWGSVAKDSVFKDLAILHEVQFTLHLDALAQGYLPVVEQLQQLRRQGVLASPTDLASLDEAAFTALLAKPGVGAPAEMPGKDAAEKITSYAAALARSVEIAYPTAAVAARIKVERGHLPHQDDLVRFFANSPDFDLGHTRVDQYLASKSATALAGVADPAGVATQLQQIQRLFALSPRWDDIRALLAGGLGPQGIAATAADRFVESQSASLGGEAAARQIHARAGQQVAMAAAVLGGYGAAFDPVHVPVLRPPTVGESANEIPEWRELFGSDDRCQCEHCRSVFGPAAYFVDLLQLLDQDPSRLSQLFQRRPDLQRIQLDCASADTPIPYVDLVNEILEGAVDSRSPAARQTTASPGDLLAAPEHLDPAAYEALAFRGAGSAQKACAPGLPFDLWIEEARVYLEHLGTSRHEILSVFQRGASPSDLEIAREYLGLSPAEHEVLAAPAATGRLFGFAASEGDWRSSLGTVAELLRRTGLSYGDLPGVLGARYVHGTTAIALVSGDPGCDLERMTVTGLTDAVLLRLHRFLRLQRKLGWATPDLDAALEQVSVDHLVIKLAQVKRLQADLGLSVAEILSFWAPADESSASPRLTLLGRALALSLPDLALFTEVAGDPFAGGDPAQTLAFVERARKLRASGFSTAQLRYLCFDQEVTAIASSPADVDALVASLRELTATTSDAVTARSLVQQSLAAALGVSVSATNTLLHALGSADSFRAGGDRDAAARTYRTLHRCALLITRFRARDEEIPRFAAVARAFDAMTPSASPAVRFQAWEQLGDLFALRDSLPRRDVHLAELFQAVTLDDPTLLLQLTGWTEEEWSAAALRVGPVVDQAAIGWIARGAALSRRIGVPLRALLAWSAPGASGDALRGAAQEIKNAAKARYDEAGWRVAARSLRDRLRELQRAALVAYLLTNPPDELRAHPQMEGLRGPEGLFAHYLIDVEMSPCMLTSRLVQATASVQLFVQRSLMNLEPGVSFTRDEMEVWNGWMRRYRVWEANRKVFIYPENYLEPGLRQDKTPFFAQLEDELTQKELTADVAEGAYRNYLDKLASIAQPDIRGFYHELSDASDVLHVFARTPGEPHGYYHRRLIRGGGAEARWTAWVKVDVAVEGDHLIPVVYCRRLFLFWPIFTEVSDGSPTIPAPNESVVAPLKHWQVKIAWSERKHDKWTAKRVSTGMLETASGALGPKEQFYFRGLVGQGATPSLTLRVYWLDAPDGHLATLGDFLFDQPDGAALALASGSLLQDSSLLVAPTISVDPGTHLDQMMLAPGAGSPHLTSGGLLSGAFLALLADLEHLRDSGDTWRVLIPHQEAVGSVQRLHFPPYDAFVQDRSASFFFDRQAGQWQVFHHPEVRSLVQRLNHAGLDGLLDPREGDPRRQLVPGAPSRVFDLVIGAAPEESVDFSASGARVDPWVLAPAIDFSEGGAHAAYNWELFFHIPLFIADRLSKNQRFAEAQRWFHTIFDPTSAVHDEAEGAPSPARFWKVRPFCEVAALAPEERIQALLRALSSREPADQPARDDLRQLVGEWSRDPFDPHLVARHRLAAYMKSVVMKYLDNLIAWGDQLFREDTLESTGEATQLYLLAAEILGRRPDEVSPPQKPLPRTYESLRAAGLDDLSNTLVGVESILSVAAGSPAPTWSPGGGWSKEAGYAYLGTKIAGKGRAIAQTPPVVAQVQSLGTALLSRLLIGSQGKALYFCVPGNSRLVGYHDTLADRLFKLRHCRDLEGTLRQLPLFEPPLDVLLLAGRDATSASGAGVTRSPYRFQVMLQRAIEVCAEVKALGGALLSTLERRDAEELSLLRSSQELRLLAEVRRVKELQLAEASQALVSLQAQRDLVTRRFTYYRDIAFMNAWEVAYLDLVAAAATLQTIGQIAELTAAAASLGPSFTAGVSGAMGTPVATVTYGGKNVADSSHAMASSLNVAASISTTLGTMSSVMGGHQRRKEEWELQRDLAQKELDQIASQLESADLRRRIAARDLANHDLTAENAATVDEFLRTRKFTNLDLFDWMAGQLSSLYFQAYQLAVSAAKRAEQSWWFEREGRSTPAADGGGASDPRSFIQPGGWDSLRKGLLAGERLSYDLKRMEMAYLEQNERECEMMKHLSLALLDPLELARLKGGGECVVDFPEVLFDLDYPGHYLRRIKSVALSVPCVLGPYTGLACTLRLESSRIRRSKTPGDDPDHFIDGAAGESIVTSGAVNESGLFEVNLRDERYLPFEGAGAVSRWKITISKDSNPFDFNTITDVVFHLRYTARSGDEALSTAARNGVLLAASRPGARLFSARHELPREWQRFLADPGSPQTLSFPLLADRFPRQAEGRAVRLTGVRVLFKMKPGAAPPGPGAFARSGDPGSGGVFAAPLFDATLGLLVTSVDELRLDAEAPGRWDLTVSGGSLTTDTVEDIGILCSYDSRRVT